MIRRTVGLEKSYVLITGATGFIGHYLLAELLRTGRRCLVLIRPPFDQSLSRLRHLTCALGFDLDRLLASERVVLMEGDLCTGVATGKSVSIDTVLHTAASTRFEPDGSGEPSRTNVGGTRHILELASQFGASHFHLISSAYVCGKVNDPVAEQEHDARRSFHNEYERSKWAAEKICRVWATGNHRTLTVFRPSVVVGDYTTGRCTRFSGFYLSARATELLSRSLGDADDHARQNVALRIKGRCDDRQNIVPVNYVAQMVAAIMNSEIARGRVYHLTHPDPPTNQQIKRAFEQYFRIGGGRFVEPAEFDRDNMNAWEESFYEISRPIEHYFTDTPTFLRAHAQSIEQIIGLRCPAYDAVALARLLRYAESVEWGRQRVSDRGHDEACARYFESFLPAHVPQSRVAKMTGLTTTIRFIIDDELDGQWACRFVNGQLVSVHRGLNGVSEDFGYRATRDVFWSAISGRVHPQELFLTGRAEVFGNVEQALKMAMILHEFNREFPCDRQTLAAWSGEAS